MRIKVYDLMLEHESSHPVLQEVKSFNYLAQGKEKKSLHSEEEVSKLLCDLFQMDRKAEEYVYMIGFNAKMRVLGVFEMGHGLVSSCLLSTREVMIRSLLVGATGIIIAHNHPSGVPTPSPEDIRLDRRFHDACELMGLQFLDNLIIGAESVYSFRRDFS